MTEYTSDTAMTKYTREQFNAFREYLADAVINAFGVWTDEVAAASLCDGAFLVQAMRDLDIDNATMECLAEDILSKIEGA